MLKHILHFVIIPVVSSIATTTAFAESNFPKLANSYDSKLQQGLEKSIDKLGLRHAANLGQLSVALVDITEIDNPRIAAINANHMMYAASLPKIAILFGVFKRIENGEIKLNRAMRKEIIQMIRYSSNPAATRILNRIGKEYLARLLRSKPYRFYDPAFNGGLWVGKEYGKAAAWRRDPLNNLSHGATVFQVARFYYMLQTGRLLSRKLSSKMKATLARSDFDHKFVNGLNTHEPGSKIYRKSGTWKTFHADSAIVERNGNRYIAVALAYNKEGDNWLRRLIVEMDHLITHRHVRIVPFSSSSVVTISLLD